GELGAIGVGHFVAVAVPLAHLAGAIGLRRARAGPEAAGIGAQPHGAAHLLDAFLGAHQRDHRVLALRLELTRVGIGDLADVAGELDDGGLEAETDAEERELVFARPADRLEHPLDAAHAETAGDAEAVIVAEQLAAGLLIGEAVRSDPVDAHAGLGRG